MTIHIHYLIIGAIVIFGLFVGIVLDELLKSRGQR